MGLVPPKRSGLKEVINSPLTSQTWELKSRLGSGDILAIHTTPEALPSSRELL